MMRKKHRTMLIHVTQDHIDAARFLDDQHYTAEWYGDGARRCPIALALATTGFNDPAVTPWDIWINKRHFGYPTSSCRQLIDRYDHDKPVKPFSFRLTLPEGW